MNTQTFEVRCVVKGNQRHYSYNLGQMVCDEITKMFHVRNVRTAEQARDRAERKWGHVVSVRKVSEKIYGDIERLPLNEPMLFQPNKALALDEMVWKKHQIRRQQNLERDHNIS